jgi:hypothetical protein
MISEAHPLSDTPIYVAFPILYPFSCCCRDKRPSRSPRSGQNSRDIEQQPLIGDQSGTKEVMSLKNVRAKKNMKISED